MLSYFQTFYVEQRYGIGLVLTSLFTVWGAMLLLTKVPEDRGFRFWLRWAAKGLLFTLANLGISSLWYWLVGDWNTERVSMAFFLVLYSWLGSRFSPQTCLVRGAVYYTSYILMIPVSEPLGQALKEINPDWYSWGQLMTPLVILVMTAAVVWFLRHYAYDRHRFAYRQVVMQLLTVALLSAAVEFVWLVLNPVPDEQSTHEKLFNVIVSAILWAVNLFNYYFFYQLAHASYQNEELIAVSQKRELELERFQATSVNYDELRMIRHEIKNHDFYLKELLDAGRCDEAKEYLERSGTADSVLLKTYECGNYMVDVILNHAMAVARKSGVEIQPEVLIPKELPWAEADICSLLSNLLDNAVEAAAQSGKEHPVVLFRMFPRQDYLFIKVINPVNESVPASRRLTLHTTKADAGVHGFGTRVMKRIAANNNGSIRFGMEDGCFVTDVMLEIQMEESNQ